MLTTIFSALGLLHVYWALAGDAGKGISVPSIDGKPLFTPSMFSTLMIAAALFTTALVISGMLGWLGSRVPLSAFRMLTLGITLVFLIRSVGDFKYVGFFKSVTGSGFSYWDTWLYSPLCLFIAAATFYIYWSEPS